MSNWSNPLLTSTYTNFLAEVKDRDTDLALQFDGTTSTNIPTNAIRWNSSINRWQKWNGTAWGELTATYALTALTTTGTIAASGSVTGTALIPSSSTIPVAGIFLPAANTLGFATATTERLRIDSNGTLIYNQSAPAAVDVTATLTVANLTANIITSSTAAAVTMTLPTGTLMDGGFSGLYNNMAFEWSVINTGATNAVTVQGGAGHTVVGSGTVAANNSQRFLSRRTAATTWVTYRLT